MRLNRLSEKVRRAVLHCSHFRCSLQLRTLEFLTRLSKVCDVLEEVIQHRKFNEVSRLRITCFEMFHTEENSHSHCFWRTDNRHIQAVQKLRCDLFPRILINPMAAIIGVKQVILLQLIFHGTQNN